MSSRLLKGVLADHPDVWMRLSSLFGPLVYYWCRRRRLSSSDAEDVVQEVFRTLVESIGDFRRDREGSTLRGWLACGQLAARLKRLRRVICRCTATGRLAGATIVFHLMPSVMSNPG